MSLPDRNNPYNFDAFQQWRQAVDYYRDDPFFRKVVKHFCGDQGERIDRAAEKISPKVSFRWRDMAERIARPEERPYILHYDGLHHRIDRIVRPRDIEVMEREVFAEALFSSQTPPWEKLVKMYLIYQNGEACIACPLTCTEGLVELLRAFADTPELKKILAHCAEGLDGHYAIGAQYLTEIQGGSDVPANVLEAVEEGGRWRVYGTKFFCSATHADYAVVTAKPAGSAEVGLFIVPSWLPGNKDREIRNGTTIDRLKWKMGTSELTTAEITFDGALAYPVGPLERGLANVVGIVLTYSRLTVGLSASAFMTRAVREAGQYARFREAFGMPIGHFPLLAGQLDAMEHAARSTTAGAFRVYHEFLGLQHEAQAGKDAQPPDTLRRRRLRVRELVMLQKITASWDAVDVIRSAMSVFGGHGVMEDFSCLPRLYRDSAVNELWEGPRNVLLTQIHRDLQRASGWYPADQFVADTLQGHDAAVVKALGDELRELAAHPDLVQMDEATLAAGRRWDAFCHRFFHAYQDLALLEVLEAAPGPVAE
jgi:alkylation response protein AidB-like acyl-CoA dehydrogenase